MYATIIKHTRRKLHHNNLRKLSTIPLSYPIYTIWSSNTSVGKTLVSAGIVSSTTSNALYLKPLQTGFPFDSDSRFVFNKTNLLHNNGDVGLITYDTLLRASCTAMREMERMSCEWSNVCEKGWEEEKMEKKVVVCKTLFAWNEAVSPHLAVQREGMVVEDGELLSLVESCLFEGVGDGENGGVFGLIETAGGVASPGSSGVLQCDLYRYFFVVVENS